MIIDILDLEDQATLRGEVVVVGSGIAGAEVATYMARQGRKVIQLESGRAKFDKAIQALNDVNFLGKPHRKMNSNAHYHQYLEPELRGVSRVRQFGGTSTVWTGKWAHLQPSDFEHRPWIEHSGWPIGYSDLLEYYNEIGKEYGFKDLEEEANRPRIKEFQSKVAAGGLKMRSFYWEKNPLRTPIRFGEEMKRSEHLKVVLGATVTRLQLDESSQRVQRICCRSLEGRSIEVEGELVILATGALETARILLASDEQIPGGLGNSYDQVGRFYTDHPKHHGGLLHPGELIRKYADELQYDPKPRFCRFFSLDDTTQREQQLLEHAVFIKPVYERTLDRLKRVVSNRPACKDDNGTISAYKVNFVTEQVPHPNSRIKLGEELDALGQRKLEVDWQFTEQDKATMDKTLRLLVQRFESSGLGTFDFGDNPPNLEKMTDAAHQIGTTRMGNHPEEGVVDSNCQVFGTSNLFVAGSAVFPVCPTYSPTYTILALARRLGKHMLKQLTTSGVTYHE